MKRSMIAALLLIAFLEASCPAFADPPPLINSLRFQSSGRVLTLTIQGVSGGQASVDLGARHLPMYEGPPGTYIQRYSLQPGESLVNARVTAYLQMPDGRNDRYVSDTTVTLGASTPDYGGGMNLSLQPLPQTYYRTGQAVSVTMLGPPAGQASFDIGNHFGIPMTERSSGVYVGTYLVQPSDVMTGVQVVGHLLLPDGTTGSAAMAQSITFVNEGYNNYPYNGPNGYPNNGYNNYPNNGYNNSVNNGVGPQLFSVQTNPPGPLVAGQTLTVSANGTAGVQASFQLTSNGRTLPMAETRPGFYTGQYVVSPYDQVTTSVTVTMRDAQGLVVSMNAPSAVTLNGGLSNAPPVATGNRVSIDDPTMRSTVLGGFSVNGRATPFSSVRVSVATTDSDTPGGKLIHREFQQVAQVDGSGRFSVPVILNGAMAGNHLEISAEALDSSGNSLSSDQVVVQLR